MWLINPRISKSQNVVIIRVVTLSETKGLLYFEIFHPSRETGQAVPRIQVDAVINRLSPF
jgi:hypothetical protein